MPSPVLQQSNSYDNGHTLILRSCITSTGFTGLVMVRLAHARLLLLTQGGMAKIMPYFTVEFLNTSRFLQPALVAANEYHIQRPSNFIRVTGTANAVGCHADCLSD